MDQNNETILVVDDNLAIRALVRAFLERAGYTVATAVDGEDGLNFFKQHQSRIALLLTDVRMPEMSGLDLADRVQELDSSVPVLFMSGSSPDVKRGLGCVAKPFTSAQLVSKVTEGLDLRRRQQEDKANAA